jgi:hypothetical protein
VFVPSPPLLVPQLCRDPAAGKLRAAFAQAGKLLAARERWAVVADCAPVDSSAVGTFAGYGADVRVGLRPGLPDRPPDAAMPLPALIAAWLRSRHAPESEAAVVGLGGPISAADALLVVGDGANTLSLKAPGYFDERAPQLQAAADAALASGDAKALLALPTQACEQIGMGGLPAWQAAARLVDGPVDAESIYCAAPFGVGYHVAAWRW